MKAKKVKGPAVNCAHDALEEPGKLKRNPKNPNRHPASQLRVYAKVLGHQGWRKSIVVSNQSGCIVTGEGAWLTAVAEGWSTVPVDYQDFRTTADEYAHLVADNRLPQMAGMDEQELAAILAAELAGVDVELTGALAEQKPKPELKPVQVKPPPKMAWVLIGIPLVRFSDINATVESITA